MSTLTAREMEVTREVASGATDRQIGARLGITAITVRNHLAAIRAKLGFSNRTQLALHWQRLEHLNQMAATIGITPAEERERMQLRVEARAGK